MTQDDSKYVSADRPVNLRTMAKTRPPPEQVHPLVQERLLALKLKNRFGAPLSQQCRELISLRQANHRKTGLHPVLIIGGIVATTSMIGLLLAAIQSSIVLAGGASLSLLIGLGLLRFAPKPQTTEASDAALIPPLFSDGDLQAFDHALALVALEVPEEIAIRLVGIKQQLLRIAQLTNTINLDEHFSLDDRHYLTESLRRYLPDSLQSYLKVPLNARCTQVIENEQTAADLLLRQIDLVQTELGKREISLNKSAAAQLVRQQRFLEAKTTERY
jgi:hypothetical protein